MRNRLLKTLMLGILLVALLVAGCVTQRETIKEETPAPTLTAAPTLQTPPQTTPIEVKTLDVQATIDYYPLGGYTQSGGEAFYVLSGDADTVKKDLARLVTGETSPATLFSEDEILNLVIFRGVFRTGGHGIRVDMVEKTGNTFTVYVTYTDPGRGMMVTEAFTQPTAIVPIGKLSVGDYESKLIVTTVLKGEGGDTVLEENMEHASIAFEVK